MNITILKKCLTELDKKEPNLSYIRGILETIIEMDSSNITMTGTTTLPYYPPTTAYVTATKELNSKVDEEIDEITKAYNAGKLGKLN